MAFTIAETAAAVAAGTITELEGLRSLVRLGHPKFDVFVWFRAARQSQTKGYGELSPLGEVIRPHLENSPMGRHVGGNDPAPPRGARGSGPGGSPPRRRTQGGRFESGATRPGG